MKGTSKVIMRATVVMVVTLAIVLGLILVLLAELYCSLLLRRRHHPKRASTTTATAVSNDVPEQPNQPNAPSLCSFYAQGVSSCSKKLPLPGPGKSGLEKQPHLTISAVHLSSAPSSYPRPVQEASPPSVGTSANTSKEQLIYICNPIYDDDAIRIINKVDTPFETPGTSPSRLETTGCSPSSNSTLSNPCSPPTTSRPTPMKKLPAEGPSVSLRDARSICTTGSDSNSNNDGISLSSSGSPCTSPSW